MDDRELVARYFEAMRRGSEAEDDLIALFHADAVYIEPFSEDGPAVGLDAIRERFRRGWETPLPELELEVVEVAIEGFEARSRWECRSPALPAPVHGEDRYEIRDGLIVRLEVRMLDT